MTPTPDRPHAPVIRWANVFHEPLASTQHRQQADQHFTHHFTQHPEWVTVWLAGVLSSTLRTLPGDDPWRNLTARLTSATGTPLTRKGNGTPTVATGATTPNGTFGTLNDVLDILEVRFNEWPIDPGLTAILPDNPPDTLERDTPLLPPETAALIAIASDGFEEATAALQALGENVHGIADGDTTFTEQALAESTTHFLHTATTALRWATFRRRCYTGRTDLFVHTQMLTWINQANDFTIGAWRPNQNNADILDNHCGDGTWAATHEIVLEELADLED